MPGELVQTHYSLRNLRVKLKTGLTPNITEMTVKRNFVMDKKWPGQAFVPSQVIMGEDIPEISGVAYADDDFNWSLVTANMLIESFDILSPNDGATVSFLASGFLTKFPPSAMTITLDQMALNDKLTTIPFTIHANMLNPGEYGGMPGYPGAVVAGGAG